MDLAWLHLSLSLALHGFATLLLVVLSLHLLKLASEALNFVLVLIDLSLVHVKLGSHGFHLVGLLLEVLLVDGQLLSNLRTRLSRKEVLELNVELLLLLDGDILLDDLLSFLDEALLECLDLQEEFEGIWVSALKLSPSVVVERVLKFLRESLDLKSLFLESISETEHFLLVLGDLRGLCFLNLELTLVLTDLVTEKFDIFESLVVLDLTLSESDLKNLDLLIEESKLIVSTDELSTEDISLGHE